MFWKFRLYGFLKNLRFFDPFLILFLREMGLSFLEIGIILADTRVTFLSPVSFGTQACVAARTTRLGVTSQRAIRSVTYRTSLR